MDLESLMAGMGPIQDTMQEQQAKRAEETIDGSAGGGAVTVTISGALAVKGVRIAPAAAAASEGDVEMLEDLITAALADALKQYQQRYGASPEEQLQKAMAGSDLMSLLGPLMGGMR